MNNDNWYRGENWDEETREQFEQRLKRARGNYNKAQYLRIKGSSLLRSGLPQKQEGGEQLLNRVINEYPDEVSEVMFAYEQLGDYYSEQKEYHRAEFKYRKSIQFYIEHGRSGSSGIADIKLAEVIIKTNQLEKYSELHNLLTDKFESTGGSLSLNEDIFRYYSALAKLCDGLRRNDLAKEYAKKALELSEIKEPQLDKYPQLGVTSAQNFEIDSLRKIAAK